MFYVFHQIWKACSDFLLLFSHSLMSGSLQPHGLHHPRQWGPSPSPGVCSNSCALSWWCHPTISPFCLQSFPASGSFPITQLFASGGQSRGASASASVLQMKTQGWFPLGWTGLISSLSMGLSRVFSSIPVQKHQFWRGCGEKGTILLCWWECKLIQPLWRTVWRFL